LERFSALAAEAPGCMRVERSRLGLPASWGGPLESPAELSAAAFDRELDGSWRRTSFSDITASTGDDRVASEPEEPVVIDEPAAPSRHAPAPGGDDALRMVVSPLSELPSGVRIGTVVHRVLEATDFAAADLEAELDSHAAPLDMLDIEPWPPFVAGLRAAIETPLGPLLEGRRLRDLARGDRLDELDFELPLAGGDVPRGLFALEGIATVLRDLPADDPLAAYADRLSDPALRHGLRGYLTGQIDLVARVGERFTVIDYKSNRLAPSGEQLTAWHYRPVALAAEMVHAHYGLQALLYAVALHRYLRWRLRGYEPSRHLGGVGYLFLRGMTGPSVPVVDGTPCGVFVWQPPGALIEAVSDVLHHGS
jgi:exodeoxyribonuclease V beta subunit